jgi:hypothetical protein
MPKKNEKTLKKKIKKLEKKLKTEKNKEELFKSQTNELTLKKK